MCLGKLIFIRDVTCKYILPVSGFSSYSIDSVSLQQKFLILILMKASFSIISLQTIPLLLNCKNSVTPKVFSVLSYTVIL